MKMNRVVPQTKRGNRGTNAIGL